MKKWIKFLLPFIIGTTPILSSCKSDTRAYIEYGDLFATESKEIELSELRAKIDNKETFLKTERENLEVTKEELETAQQEEELKRYKVSCKNKLLSEHKEVIEQLNNHEKQLLTINEFIHKSIELCNQKAKAITGFDFVMLEETLSETIKEVCYLSVDGVPFKDVNTSRKLIIGTQFIKRVKEILNAKNNLPIMADKLETVSQNTLTNYNNVFSDIQFITTRVTNGKELKVTW